MLECLALEYSIHGYNYLMGQAAKRLGGLDHLAVQAPCISLYGKMLPGITNVTDRARYYSFYPWVIRSLEKKGHRYGDTFIDLFRKADCLFTLIAKRHAKVTGGDDHAAATVGSGIRHNVLMMDASQATLAVDRNPPRSAGRYYTRGKIAEDDTIPNQYKILVPKSPESYYQTRDIELVAVNSVEKGGTCSTI